MICGMVLPHNSAATFDRTMTQAPMKEIRIGIIGLGQNTRERHVPGLLEQQGVKLTGVCNRRPESTQQAASDFQIPRTFEHWEQLVADPDIDAVVVGTWPYLHCEITLAALAAGKHVLTEARMARNAGEALQMLQASQQRNELTTQIVPSPFGLRVHQVVKEMLAEGYLGELREAVVWGTNDALADPQAPLHWRQSAQLSGLNMLMLGILHETLSRWVPHPVSVMAQTDAFIPHRIDPLSGALVRVGTPDSVRAWATLPNGGRVLYHLSSVIHFGPGLQIHLYGSEGTLKVDLAGNETLWGARRGDSSLQPIRIPAERAGCWRVEEEFIRAIRGQEQVTFTNFETGMRYMQFTEAVARSAQAKTEIRLD